MIGVLKGIGFAWLALVSIAATAGLVWIGMNHGFWAMVLMLSPLNAVYWLITLLALVPGLVALGVAGALEKERRLLEFDRDLRRYKAAPPFTSRNLNGGAG